MHPSLLMDGKSCVSVAIGLIAEYYTIIWRGGSACHPRYALFQKLGAANRTEAVAIALRKHLLKI